MGFEEQGPEVSREPIATTDTRSDKAVDDHQEFDVVSESDESELYKHNEVDEVYFAKSKLLNEAIQEIGMGKYQWQLFVLAGFGWFSDNMWPTVTSLVLTPIQYELHPPDDRGPYLTLGQNLGLLAGAAVWSLSSDVVGRKWAFNLTFLITGIFGLVAGASPNFASACVFSALWSFGVGGNLPIDSAIFLEALPASHQYLLTIMSVWWALGAVVINLISWGLLGNFSCAEPENCVKADNMGWRYLLYTAGGLSLIMFIARFVFFKLYESPKFLMSKGDDRGAVEVIHRIAEINKKTSFLTLEALESLNDPDTPIISTANVRLSRRLRNFNLAHIRAVFATKRLIVSSSLVIAVWAIIGLAFPLYNAFLPYYLQTRGNAIGESSTYITYRNALIISVLGVPGSILGGLLVDLRTGRKGILALSTALTGVFIMCSTTSRSRNALLGWDCAYNFCSSIMYGVLYAYTPEIFPTKIRGTGVGLASSANRILGVFAPIIGMFANLQTSAPIFVSGSLFFASTILEIIFPYEPRGKASL